MTYFRKRRKDSTEIGRKFGWREPSRLLQGGRRSIGEIQGEVTLNQVNQGMLASAAMEEGKGKKVSQGSESQRNPWFNNSAWNKKKKKKKKRYYRRRFLPKRRMGCGEGLGWWGKGSPGSRQKGKKDT